jgi:hypothetical protein
VKTVKTSIVNTDGYTVLDIIANVVPIDVVLLALEKNASPVVSVEHMEPMTQRTMQSTYVAIDKSGDGNTHPWCGIDFDDDLMSEF